VETNASAAKNPEDAMRPHALAQILENQTVRRSSDRSPA
jgi:hypothetical protein